MLLLASRSVVARSATLPATAVSRLAATSVRHLATRRNVTVAARSRVAASLSFFAVSRRYVADAAADAALTTATTPSTPTGDAAAATTTSTATATATTPPSPSPPPPASEKPFDANDYQIENPPRPRCFNCGSRAHAMRACPSPKAPAATIASRQRDYSREWRRWKRAMNAQMSRVPGVNFKGKAGGGPGGYTADDPFIPQMFDDILRGEDDNIHTYRIWKVKQHIGYWGSRPILDPAVKDEIYRLWREDPAKNSDLAMAQRFGLARARIRAIIHLKQLEQDARERGEEILGDHVDYEYGKLFGMVSHDMDSPEMNPRHGLYVNHAPRHRFATEEEDTLASQLADRIRPPPPRELPPVPPVQHQEKKLLAKYSELGLPPSTLLPGERYRSEILIIDTSKGPADADKNMFRLDNEGSMRTATWNDRREFVHRRVASAWNAALTDASPDHAIGAWEHTVRTANRRWAELNEKGARRYTMEEAQRLAVNRKHWAREEAEARRQRLAASLPGDVFEDDEKAELMDLADSLADVDTHAPPDDEEIRRFNRRLELQRELNLDDKEDWTEVMERTTHSQVPEEFTSMPKRSASSFSGRRKRGGAASGAGAGGAGESEPRE